MNDYTPQDGSDEVEGHGYRKPAAPVEDDTEGHMPRTRATQEDDVKGHGISARGALPTHEGTEGRGHLL